MAKLSVSPSPIIEEFGNNLAKSKSINPEENLDKFVDDEIKKLEAENLRLKKKNQKIDSLNKDLGETLGELSASRERVVELESRVKELSEKEDDSTLQEKIKLLEESNLKLSQENKSLKLEIDALNSIKESVPTSRYDLVLSTCSPRVKDLYLAIKSEIELSDTGDWVKISNTQLSEKYGVRVPGLKKRREELAELGLILNKIEVVNNREQNFYKLPS